MRKIVGYGICGNNEADRYLKKTLDNFKELCDETIILLNGASEKERDCIQSYGFKTVEDDREWGKNQHRIKEDFVRNHVAKLNPDITICLDMDEVLVNVTREDIEAQFEKGHAFYVYIVNLWEKGYRRDWSFWNVRMWGWDLKDELGDQFFKFEDRPLHCGLAPKWCYALNVSAPFVLEHYGLMKREDRQKKVERYRKYDPTRIYRAASYYEALDTDHYEEYNREDIIKSVEKEVETLKQPEGKKPPMANQSTKVLIIREADGLTFDVDVKDVQHYLKQKFQGKGFRQVDEAPVAKRSVAPVVKSKPKQTDNSKTFVYVACHGNQVQDDTEGHIARALEELGHKVIKVQQDVDKEIPDGDFLLFHKWIPDCEFSGKKVCWFFDKICFKEREEIMDEIAEKSDYVFGSDRTGGSKYDNFTYLPQGVGYDYDGGQRVEAPRIVFTGTAYGDREKWVNALKNRYGDDFEAINGIHRADLNDLCVSADIVLAPEYPCDDGYFSNRVWHLVGRGAFMIHPRSKALEEEMKEGEHIVCYGDMDEMFEKIDYYLEHEEEREKIRKAGVEKVRKDYKYSDRVNTLCSRLLEKEN